MKSWHLAFFSSRNHFFHQGVGLSKADIIGNRVLEEIHIMEYKAEILRQCIHAILFDVSSTQRDDTTVHIPESGKQMAQCGFTTARFPTEQDTLPVWNFQRNIPQGRNLCFRILEMNVFYLYHWRPPLHIKAEKL